MRYSIKLISVFLLSISFFIYPAGKDQKGKLIIKFSGLSSSSGVVKVAICNSETNYKDHRAPFIGKSLPIINNKAVIELDELQFGEYAVKAFHDEDSNDDLNTNFLGIPVEDYGFSNNARGMFGPPAWQEAKLMLNETSKIIEIVIK